MPELSGPPGSGSSAGDPRPAARPRRRAPSKRPKKKSKGFWSDETKRTGCGVAGFALLFFSFFAVAGAWPFAFAWLFAAAVVLVASFRWDWIAQLSSWLEKLLGHRPAPAIAPPPPSPNQTPGPEAGRESDPPGRV